MWKNLSIIGKCKYFPIPKAALLLYYEDDEYKEWDVDYGNLDLIHKIVTTAGGEHCSVATGQQVLARLRASPYWKNTSMRGVYSGIGNGKAAFFSPSEKGKVYYEKHLAGKLTLKEN